MRLSHLALAATLVASPMTMPQSAQAAREPSSFVMTSIPTCAECATFEYLGTWYVNYFDGCFDTENCAWCPDDEPCSGTQWEIGPGEDGENWCYETRCQVDRLALARKAATALSRGDLASVRSHILENQKAFRVSSDGRRLEVVSCNQQSIVAALTVAAGVTEDLSKAIAR